MADNSPLRLQHSECHWCEEPITRSAPNFKWFGLNNDADCVFHPVAWDEERFESTNMSAPHMTTLEVHDLVRNEYIRRKALQMEPARKITDNIVSIAKRAQRTSRQAAEKLEPNAGTIRYQVFSAIKNNNGLTDYELETLLKGKHQTVSASRRSLVIDGWLIDSGMTRKNSQGNDCIVWVINRSATQGVLL